MKSQQPTKNPSQPSTEKLNPLNPATLQKELERFSLEVEIQQTYNRLHCIHGLDPVRKKVDTQKLQVLEDRLQRMEGGEV
jgi:hypothetical protein